MKKVLLMVSLLYIFLLNCSFAKAGMSQLSVTDKVDTVTMAPVDSKNVFSVDAPEIWATAYLENIPPDSTVGAVWLYYDEKAGAETVLTRVETKAEGSRYAAFRIMPNARQFFLEGRYQVQFMLNNEKVGSVDFKVTRQILSESNPVPQPPMEVKYMNYKDKEGRFTVDLPGEWYPAEIPNPNTVVFLSMNMEDKPLVRLSISVFNATLSETYTPKNAVIDLRNKLHSESQQIDAALIKDELTEERPDVATWIMWFKYPSAGGKLVEDRKVITCQKGRVYLVNFICESEILPVVWPIFLHVAETFLPT